MFSRSSLKLYAMMRRGVIKSNSDFWRKFLSYEEFESFDIDYRLYQAEIENKNLSLICVFDECFPKFDFCRKQSERSFLFAYKGNVKLLTDSDNIVGVVGTLYPDSNIEKRERKIVKALVDNDCVILSGLAKGVDTIAHQECLFLNGKTIAVLPTTFDSVYPQENSSLLDRIIESGGLAITEYVTEPKNGYQSIGRFIERDRIQAALSKNVILIASHKKGAGDSGSRHAMNKAKEYKKGRYVMFDNTTDLNLSIFGLNREQISDGAQILTKKTVDEIKKNDVRN